MSVKLYASRKFSSTAIAQYKRERYPAKCNNRADTEYAREFAGHYHLLGPARWEDDMAVVDQNSKYMGWTGSVYAIILLCPILTVAIQTRQQ